MIVMHYKRQRNVYIAIAVTIGLAVGIVLKSVVMGLATVIILGWILIRKLNG